MLKDVKKTIEVNMFYTQSSAKPSSRGTFKISNINFVNIRSTNPKAAGEFLCDPKSPCGVRMNGVVQNGLSLSYKCSHALVSAVGSACPRPCIAPGEAPSGDASNTNITGSDPVEVSDPALTPDDEDDNEEAKDLASSVSCALGSLLAVLSAAL
eukprot:m51a1_g12996 hypothetical protein (154) ;mRNA; r:2221-2682